MGYTLIRNYHLNGLLYSAFLITMVYPLWLFSLLTYTTTTDTTPRNIATAILFIFVQRGLSSIGFMEWSAMHLYVAFIAVSLDSWISRGLSSDHMAWVRDTCYLWIAVGGYGSLLVCAFGLYGVVGTLVMGTSFGTLACVSVWNNLVWICGRSHLSTNIYVGILFGIAFGGAVVCYKEVILELFLKGLYVSWVRGALLVGLSCIFPTMATWPVVGFQLSMIELLVYFGLKLLL